ncbi:Gfo/Idh/MocA family protein [Sphingomonas sp. 35-24ZXX]|uniref:Gfo/Idh/MocA family protein n=1 Tax=Sphingomonas sp. 35-24ZXX TaxID=1545915 RepID=UPI00053BFAA0|nr:Gfo/Idh/MocA family oxidoreductase [Sphingomonas sp. 35-24ZXX]
MTLRVGIVSAGWGAFAHLPAWRAIPGVEVTAICTSCEQTARAAQQRLGLPLAFWDAEAMCADPDIDIVDLGTRPSVRLPMVLAAIRNGKHIYNACPHAPDWAGALAIDAALAGSHTLGVIDAFSEHLPAHRQMQVMLDDGYIGEPLGGICHFNLSLFNRPDKRFPYGWFADGSAGVSAVRNNGSHMLHVLTRMLGPVDRLVADDTQVLKQWVYPDGDTITPQTNDFANVILKFRSGLTMTMQVGWNMPLASGWMIDLHGTKGRLRAESPTFPTARDCVLHGGQLGGVMELIAMPEAYKSHPDIALDWEAEIPPSFPMAITMKGLVDAISGQGHPAPDFRRALEIERILEAIRRSNTARSWMSLDQIGREQKT